MIIFYTLTSVCVGPEHRVLLHFPDRRPFFSPFSHHRGPTSAGSPVSRRGQTFEGLGAFGKTRTCLLSYRSGIDPIEAAAHYFRGHAPLWTRIYSYSKSLGYFWMQLSWSWKELLKCTYSNRKVTFKEEIYHLCLKSVLHCGFSRVRLPPPSKHLHVSVNVLK